MKIITALLLSVSLFGCAHKRWVCEGGGESTLIDSAETFYANFRDNHLLLVDVILSGSVQEGRTAELSSMRIIRGDKQTLDSRPCVDRSMFVVSCRFESREMFDKIEIGIEHGIPGSSNFTREVIFRASSFEGSAAIDPTECRGAVDDTNLVLNFRRDFKWFRLVAPLKSALQNRPNQPLQTTPTAVTPAAGAPGAPAAGVPEL